MNVLNFLLTLPLLMFFACGLFLFLFCGLWFLVGIFLLINEFLVKDTRGCVYENDE